MALAATTMAAGLIAEAMGLQIHPPPGKLVDVGGYRLHLNCQGQGSPTVVLDSGAGGTSLDWSWIQPDIAKQTRVCAYDRASAAWSDPGPPPRDAAQMARELNVLLRNAGESGPIILVGASFGGHIARLYLSSYPEDVRGLVLVDARPEDWDRRFPEIRAAGEAQLGTIRALSTFSRLGITRLILNVTGPPAMVHKYPSDIQPTLIAVGFQARSFDAILDLAGTIVTSDEQVRRIPGPVSVPVIVLTHGIADPDLFAGLPPESWHIAEVAWQQMQRQLYVRLGGRLVVATTSGHVIALDQPEAVTNAITEIVHDARPEAR